MRPLEGHENWTFTVKGADLLSELKSKVNWKAGNPSQPVMLACEVNGETTLMRHINKNLLEYDLSDGSEVWMVTQ